MVFTGRPRGRGVSGRGGGIHATTRKRNPGHQERSDRPHIRDRSDSPPRKRAADRLGAQYPEKRTPTPQESLRITVGNDIFNKGSPLSDRLGPPVEEGYQKGIYESEVDVFEQERMYYGVEDDDDSDHKRRKDNWQRDSPGRRYESDSRHRERDREDRRDRREIGRDRRDEVTRDRRDDNDRDRRDDIFRDRRDEISRERRDDMQDRRDDIRDRRDDRDRRNSDHRDDYRIRHRSDDYIRDIDRDRIERHESRRELSRDRDIYERFDSSKEILRDDRKRYRDEFEDRADFPYRKRHDSDRLDRFSRERSLDHLHTSRSPENYYRRESVENLRSPPRAEPTPPSAKPLKSILKKKSDKVEEHLTPQIESRLGPPPASKFGSEGVGYSMDIDDEERFLYGEPERKPEAPPWGGTSRRNDFDSHLAYSQPQNNTFPILQSQKSYSPPRNYLREKPPVEQSYDSSDLLSIFTNKSSARYMEETHHKLSDSMHTESNKTAGQEKYDPTIENILKSIGFDFEMSKRMQEKANNPVPKKEDPPQQYGIDQTASFLSGGISGDHVRDNLFPKKDSSVDSMVREIKEKGNVESYSERLKKKPSFVDEVLSKESFGKKDYIPHVSEQSVVMSEVAAPPVTPTSYPTSTGYPSYTQSYGSQPYQMPPYSASYSVPQPQPAQPYPYMTDYSGVQLPYPGMKRGEIPPQIPPPQQQTSPTGGRANLKSIPLSFSKKLPELTSTSKQKKNQRPNLKELTKEMTVEVKTSVSESTRTVLPPRNDIKKMQPTKRPAERSQVISESSAMDKAPKSAEKLLKDKEERKKRILALEEELTKLRRQQNEIIRKKRRQKDGHKDPILLQNSRLQEEIAQQISKLRKLTGSKNEDDGSPQNKKSRTEESIQNTESSSVKKTEPLEVKIENKPEEKATKRTVTKQPVVKEQEPVKEEESTPKVSSKQVPPVKEETKPKQFSFQVKGQQKVRMEFFDSGNHWCKLCNTVFTTALQFLEHTHQRHNKKWKNTDNFDRPWIPDEMKNPPPKKKSKKVDVVPLKGPEFLFPTNGFYCVLCREFSGDVQCAEFHLKTENHHMNYKKFLEDSPFYEQRRQLDRAKGIAEKQEKTLKEKESKTLFSKQNPEDKPPEKSKSNKLSEKEVEELTDVESNTKGTTAKQAKVKLSLKKPLSNKPTSQDSSPKLSSHEEKRADTDASMKDTGKKSEDDTSKKSEDDPEKKEDDKKAAEESKKQIAIKISNKIGIIGKVPAKKNVLLPPWTPVARQDPKKVTKSIELDKSKTKPTSAASDKKPQFTAQDILKAVKDKAKENEAKKEQERIESENAKVKPNPEDIPMPSCESLKNVATCENKPNRDEGEIKNAKDSIEISQEKKVEEKSDEMSSESMDISINTDKNLEEDSKNEKDSKNCETETRDTIEKYSSNSVQDVSTGNQKESTDSGIEKESSISVDEEKEPTKSDLNLEKQKASVTVSSDAEDVKKCSDSIPQSTSENDKEITVSVSNISVDHTVQSINSVSGTSGNVKNETTNSVKVEEKFNNSVLSVSVSDEKESSVTIMDTESECVDEVEIVCVENSQKSTTCETNLSDTLVKKSVNSIFISEDKEKKSAEADMNASLEERTGGNIAENPIIIADDLPTEENLSSPKDRNSEVMEESDDVVVIEYEETQNKKSSSELITFVHTTDSDNVESVTMDNGQKIVSQMDASQQIVDSNSQKSQQNSALPDKQTPSSVENPTNFELAVDVEMETAVENSKNRMDSEKGVTYISDNSQPDDILFSNVKHENDQTENVINSNICAKTKEHVKTSDSTIDWSVDCAMVEEIPENEKEGSAMENDSVEKILEKEVEKNAEVSDNSLQIVSTAKNLESEELTESNKLPDICSESEISVMNNEDSKGTSVICEEKSDVRIEEPLEDGMNAAVPENISAAEPFIENDEDTQDYIDNIESDEDPQEYIDGDSQNAIDNIQSDEDPQDYEDTPEDNKKATDYVDDIQSDEDPEDYVESQRDLKGEDIQSDEDPQDYIEKQSTSENNTSVQGCNEFTEAEKEETIETKESAEGNEERIQTFSDELDLSTYTFQTVNNDDVTQSGEEDDVIEITLDEQDVSGSNMTKMEGVGPMQDFQCRPIEDVIEVSMGSLGDVVDVAVGNVGETDNDMDCNVDQLYGVIGGEMENLDDVLSVGSQGCFASIGVKPMDVTDILPNNGETADNTEDEAVGEIVDQLMQENDVESDPESDGSGISMHMGSDFEVIDECEDEV